MHHHQVAMVQGKCSPSMASSSSSPNNTNNNHSQYLGGDMMRTSEKRGLFLADLLVTCVNLVAAGNFSNANVVLEQISHLASSKGDAMQRVAAYFNEALAHRVLRGWPGMYKALNSTRITSLADENMARKRFFELCPFMKVSYVITNEAIMEAMEGEKVVHIIDLNSCEPSQWVSFLKAMSSRRGGPPHIRLTGVHEHKEVLEKVARRLCEEAEKLDIPFQFNPIVTKLKNLEIESLPVKMGEALAISSQLQLHPLLSSSSSSSSSSDDDDGDDLTHNHTSTPSCHLSLSTLPKITAVLNALRDLSPKLMVITEKEANHNVGSLVDRTMEALKFYGALFDSMESTLPRASLERQKVEKTVFGEEINNIVACDGAERTERHEKLDKWIVRLEESGFRRLRLSYRVLMHGKRLLHGHNNYTGYNIKDQGGCFFICWHNQPLFSVSAWNFQRLNG